MDKKLLADLYSSAIALESEGNQEVEIEHSFVCRCTDKSFLSKAEKMVTMEQYEIRSIRSEDGLNAVLRMRATQEGEDDVEYMFATKVYQKDGGCHETELLVTVDLFNAFKQMAPFGSKKKRHYLKDESDRTWEIDVYSDDEGNDYEWFRAELEVMQMEGIPNLPFECDEVIYTNDADEATRTKVDGLHQKYFSISNPDNIAPILTPM